MLVPGFALLRDELFQLVSDLVSSQLAIADLIREFFHLILKSDDLVRVVLYEFLDIDGVALVLIHLSKDVVDDFSKIRRWIVEAGRSSLFVINLVLLWLLGTPLFALFL